MAWLGTWQQQHKEDSGQRKTMTNIDRYRTRRLLLLTLVLTLVSLITITSSSSHGIKLSKESLTKSNYFPSKLSDILREFQAQTTGDFGNEANFEYPIRLSPEGKPRATFYMMLTQVQDIAGALKSIKSVENRFNKKHHYDWVFAYQGEMPTLITDTLTKYCSGPVHFAVIAEDDQTYALKNTTNLESAMNFSKSKLRLIPYGDSLSFRKRNRFQSWGFQNLKEMQQFDYFCNVDVDTELECDITHDFFQFMYDNDMLYGFVHAPAEPVSTTKLYWKAVIDMIEGPKVVANPAGLLEFLVDEKGSFTKCTFGSNLEVGSLGFFRSKKYREIFEHMDKTDGFFVDRWLDSNIHTLAVALLLPRDKVYWIENTGYVDGDARSVCPLETSKRMMNRCSCDPAQEYGWGKNSCLRSFFQINDLVLPAGVPDIKPFKARYRKLYNKKADDKRNPTLKKLSYMSEAEINELLD